MYSTIGSSSQSRSFQISPFTELFVCFVFLVFLPPHLRHREVPRLGVKLELQRVPTPPSQQGQVRAASVTYPTACSNAGSLTHWARPGMELASSQRWHHVLNPQNYGGNSGKSMGLFFFLSFFFFPFAVLNWGLILFQIRKFWNFYPSVWECWSVLVVLWVMWGVCSWTLGITHGGNWL